MQQTMREFHDWRPKTEKYRTSRHALCDEPLLERFHIVFSGTLSFTPDEQGEGCSSLLAHLALVLSET
jgi:hypothetical protein